MRNLRRRLGWSALVAASMTIASPAVWAYGGASRSTHVFPSRYLACHDDDRAAPPVPEPRAPGGEALVPIPMSRGTPELLRMVDDVADDVAYTEPVPARVGGAALVQAAPAPLRRDGRNAFPCLGLMRGKAGIVRVLTAPPGTRFYYRNDADDWRADNMVAAAMFGVQEAIPGLRAALARPVSDPRQFGPVALRTEACITLSALGDTASTPAMVSWLRELETISWANLWRDTFESLAMLAPVEAERYSLGLLGRAADRTLGQDIPSDRLAVLEVLTLRTRDEALPLLQRLTASPGGVPFDGSGHAYCLLLAARLRLKDDVLVAEAREQMAGELTNHRAIHCFGELRDALPRDEPSDVGALIHRRAYESMLRWLELPASPANQEARRTLRDWLVRTMDSPEVSQPDHVAFRRSTRARHLAALAFLGDAKARALLRDMVVDRKDDTDAPWIAAALALRFGLPHALDDAKARLQLGMTQSTSNRWFDSSIGPESNWRTRMLEEMIRQAPGDASWTAALLDATVPTREWAFWRLTRLRPAGACAVIAAAARGATDDAVNDAFWALTTLGDRCRPAIEPLAREPSTPPVVRGAAIEYLAMIRHPDAVALARGAAEQSELRAASRRALIIARSRE